MTDPRPVYPADIDLSGIQNDLPLDISEIIERLCDRFQELYGLSPYDINCGDCELFADCVCFLVPGARAYWGDELIQAGDDPDQYSYHCIVKYGDMFYDSQHPEGVDDFRLISAFQH